MKCLKWCYLRTPSNMSPMFKYVCAYFLFLANIPRDLWTLFIGTPFYLRNWCTWYSRMTWCLLVLAKYLSFLLQKGKFNSKFLEWSSFIPTMAKYLFMIKSSTYVACSVLSLVKFLDRDREMFHASKIRIHLHPPYKSRLSHREVKHNMLSPSTQNFANSYTQGCAHISTK